MRKTILTLVALALFTMPLAYGADKTAPAQATPAKPAQESEDPVEKELKKIMEEDDAAQDDADKWIKEAKAFEEKGAGLSQASLNARIRQRFDEVKQRYEKLLQAHPGHARTLLAYGSFLNDTGEEEEAVPFWEKARAADPKNPAAWNNLANHYGHQGPVTKAFEYYGKAMEIAPEEPVYLQNLATTIYLFRQDAMEHYRITEEEVFAKALELYRKALKLDPKNFTLATDLAQSYYGIRPLRTEEALKAWEYALKVANDPIEREGVYLHMARVELNSGRFTDAHRHILSVTNQMYDALKGRLLRSLNDKQKRATESKPDATLELNSRKAPAAPTSPTPLQQPPSP